MALMDQWAGFSASDPIPEEEAISTRLVSLTARPRHKEGEALRAPTRRAGLFWLPDVLSANALGPAVPISTFEPQYAEEGLIVSKCEHRVVKLHGDGVCCQASDCSQGSPGIKVERSILRRTAGKTVKSAARPQLNAGFFAGMWGLRMSRPSGSSFRKLIVGAICALTVSGLAPAPAFSQQAAQAGLLHGAALKFGMNAGEVSQVLGVPLAYVRGRPGNELLLAIPNVKGSALSIRSDALYLQFRRGRLSGWKGDWGTITP
ncbi:MAG: hypothetical protein WA820_11495 [Bradyrhizobium sp.]